MSTNFVWAVLLLLLVDVLEVDAAVPCNTTADCVAVIKRPGVICMSDKRICSNPYQSGCLVQRMSGWKRKRLCNSDDPSSAAKDGICRPPNPDLNHMELRIAGQNWEAVFFEGWILQIILSEILDVPVTIETGYADMGVSLYDPYSRFDYGIDYPWSAFDVAARVGDCRKVKQLTPSSNYTPCAHVMNEVWSGETDNMQRLMASGVMEPYSYNGVVGQEGWFIPRFTAERDPSLLSYLGYIGEGNRQKLADMFLRPTTWSDYCLQVSSNNCSTPDNVAIRGPSEDSEKDRMFVDGLYWGYFRKTEENNCTRWPSNCTGHFADYPCGWASYIVPISHYMNIALNSSGPEPVSRGYSYQQLTDIWYAANWTKSNVIMQLWWPQSLYQLFQGTDSEFLGVNIGSTTRQCLAKRILSSARCTGTWEERIGVKEGVCTEPVRSVIKAVVSRLYEKAINPARQSPAYETVKNFQINQFQLAQIFDYWNSDFDFNGFGPRDATCQWVIENFISISGYIPRTFPRAIRKNNHSYHETLYTTSIILSVFALGLTLLSFVLTYLRRREKALKHAQVDFLFLLLTGVLLVSGAAVFQALTPSHFRCLAVIWLANLGKTLELVPLVVKIGAINRLVHAAKKMKRIKLTRKDLFKAVAMLSAVVVVFLTLWSLLDPPKRVVQLELTAEQTSEGETIIESTYYCQSQSPLWNYIMLSALAFLLLCASVLAFQIRKLRQDMNESQTLAALIYFQFLFVSSRLVVYILWSNLDAAAATHVLSLLYSLDSMATIFIYFLPKLCAQKETNAKNNVVNSSQLSNPSTSDVNAANQQNARSSQESDQIITQSAVCTRRSSKSVCFAPDSKNECSDGGFAIFDKANVKRQLCQKCFDSIHVMSSS